MMVFFQQTEQLQYLVQQALPEMIRIRGSGIRHKLMVWSAGCFSGEEPYSLGIVLSEFAARYPGLGFHFLILATDASPNVLTTARKAIYHEDSVQLVPSGLRRKYLLRSKDQSQKLIRVNSQIRDVVRFRRVRSLDGELSFREPIDIIFCSSLNSQVGKDTWSRLTASFCRYLMPGGYLFLRDPHPQIEAQVPLQLVAPTIYKRIEL
ncbi:MAG TPA: chemotaxis protein CheR [Syntrophobacteraceae bacterium]|nr:chemotaxis protein CheR [Syntrophobacteraceae bacterium]